MIDYAAHFRRRFIRELWRRLGRDAGERPIAIYGAGRHTQWLLETVATVERGPTVGVILDDSPRSEAMSGVRVARSRDESPAEYAFVVVSSDSQATALADAAREWAGSGDAAHTPEVIEPYRGLPEGPYPDGATNDAPVNNDRVIPGDADEDALDRAQQLGESMAVPSGNNRAGYSPETDASYVESGRRDREIIGRVLSSHGIELSQAKSILDWGCSTARVLRQFADLPQRPALWGCDIDETAIEWGQRHLGERLRLFSCTLDPHLPVPDASFDLVYGISIFTHISHGIDNWLMELRRVTKPGGAVLVTVHDEQTWAMCEQRPELFVAQHCPRFDFSAPLTDDFVSHGQGPSSQTFWHSRGIRRRWSAYFEIAGIERLAFCGGTQSGVVLRPRA